MTHIKTLCIASTAFAWFPGTATRVVSVGFGYLKPGVSATPLEWVASSSGTGRQSLEHRGGDCRHV
ncbi:MAG: hypothetical protein H6953_14025 [Chromatiaceae bacterium]|nr:hypothetical protein [Chromatiaceae bacterium]MCP5312109.1 hypothetical protein [Chromatiaceae bacterium]